tara:strand:- start:2107 stop:2883 length:777 start_codon:yes stop_codon:yes gene_type:complete
MGYINKKKLEDVCVLRQPVTFLLEEDKIEKMFNLNVLGESYSTIHLQVYDMSNSTEVPISLPIMEVVKLFNQKKDYVSYNNVLITEDTLFKSKLRLLEGYLAPPMTVYSNYDIWLGTEDKKLPIKTESYYREYIYITSGYVECLLITPNKEKQQSIVLNKSEVLYIPPYWSYEISLKKNAFICVFRYDTVLSICSRIPTLIHNYIDTINTTKVSLKLKTNIKEITDNNNEISSTESKESGDNLSKKGDTDIDPSNNVI